jgi:hypothetical protein
MIEFVGTCRPVFSAYLCGKSYIYLIVYFIILSKIITCACIIINKRYMKNILAAIGAISIGISSVNAEEKPKNAVGLSSTAITSNDNIGIKSSLEFTADKVHFYLTHGDDPRFGIEDFTSGGISWTDKNLSLGARGLLLNNEEFGEIYGKLTGKIDYMDGIDAWVRVGITTPTGINLGSGANIALDNKNKLLLLGSHQEGLSDGPQGTLLKAQLTHDFGNGISLYSSLDHWDGDDSSYIGSNTLDKNGPGFATYALHGQGFTGNLGAKYAGDNTTAHLKASYNEEGYWNFTGELSKKLSEKITLSGGILIDTRDTTNKTGYVGVKYKF